MFLRKESDLYLYSCTDTFFPEQKQSSKDVTCFHKPGLHCPLNVTESAQSVKCKEAFGLFFKKENISSTIVQEAPARDIFLWCFAQCLMITGEIMSI